MRIQSDSKKKNLKQEIVEKLLDDHVMIEDEEETLDITDVDLSEDVGIDEETEKELESFTAGIIPQKDLDATRMYLNEIGFSPLLNVGLDYMDMRLLHLKKSATKLA